ncbi:MAG: hypothetical protein CVT66_10685 [Actinobacteria bacterium HGW-Actinobacteria-6]|jgi:hypothetical protein|nr:MAG: hypothetical protein CVT66_10685 [Actinobacteria bacterium HGW-Actinobacteria-6]
MRSGTRAAAVVVALVLVSATLMGCGSSSTDTGTGGTEAVPVPGTGTGVVGDGAALVESKCTACHNLERVDAATKDLVGWQTTITRMVQQNGAVITPEEQSAIALYLSNR